MKTFVINLKKNSERMRKVSERLTQFAVSYERIEAVYGLDLSDQEKRQRVDFFHWWCVRGCFPRDGEIGCSLSHLNVYRRMVNEKIPLACLLEDDVVMTDQFPRQLAAVEKWMRTDVPQVVLLTNYCKEKSERWEILPTAGDSSTEAYVINLSAVQRLVAESKRVYLTADAWRYRVQKGWIEIFHAFPTVMLPEWRFDGNVSDVTTDVSAVPDVRKMTFLQKFIWKCKRCLGKVSEEIFYR